MRYSILVSNHVPQIGEVVHPSLDLSVIKFGDAASCT